MRNILLITRRELSAYFRSMSGYVIAALFLLSTGIFFHALAMGDAERRSSDVLRVHLARRIVATPPAP